MPNPRPEPPAAIKTDGTFVLPVWMRVVGSLPLFVLALLIVPPGLSGGGVSVVFRMIIVVLILGFVVRSFLLKLVLGDDGVTIVNWRSTKKLPWSDVDAFGHDRRGLWVRRRNKQEVLIAAFAIGRSLPPVRKLSKATADELELIRKKRRGPGKNRKRY